MENEEEIFKNRIDLAAVTKAVDDIKQTLNQIVFGQEEVIDLVLIGMLSDGHLLIEGVPGVAKTMMSKLLGKVLDVSFKRIQFTPDLMPSDVLGTSVFNPKTLDFEYRPGPVFGNIVLIDEINRAPAKTQAALFELMEERQITIDGHTYLMDSPFVVLATQNPIEQEGTYRLPEAQLDRFLFKINIGYPSPEHEVQMLKRFNYNTYHDLLNGLQPVLNKAVLTELRQLVRQVIIEDNLLKYITLLIQATRNNKLLELGASPRASVALMLASKARAALSGRDFVIPEDVKSMAKPTLRHRVILTPDAEMEGVNEDEVLDNLFSKVEIPR
ncbi:MoxR family ATPase [Emticicia sp. 21SJ11W-3]|uniref:AAA family ATPase n=1 Tax=Emticicia sp. 21SJ11W-3 TaxID=2916755 RepID=UPI0020A060B3|nr:MoxR family ATPase [Emticicia sp. 21SJ11W-3]UTA69560.1 MoxR family ATPase [Emticicia sp. 21SJ11W-3]